MTNFDEVMRALSDSRRLEIVDSLREEEVVRPFSDDGDGRNPAIQLHHVHLPLLEEKNLVEWNRNTGTVRKGDEFDVVEPVLTALEAQSDALLDECLPNERQPC